MTSTDLQPGRIDPLTGLKAGLGRTFGRQSYAMVPMGLVFVLVVISVIIDPSFFSPSNFITSLAVSAPIILAALAQTFPLMSGNGGLDLSVGPVLGFVTVLIAGVLVPNGLAAAPIMIPIIILFGIAVGAFNGILVAYVRLPAIIATLATYLIFSGLSAEILPQPKPDVPLWLVDLTHTIGVIPGILIVYVVLLIGWLALLRTSYVRNLLAVGGDDRAAYTAGVNVSVVRVIAFALSGLLASIGGLLLAGTIQSGDARVGSIYTVISITAVCLGGISLTGGRGGLFGAALGGVAYFLIQHLLTVAQVSVFQLSVASGVVLIIALGLNGFMDELRKRRGRKNVATTGDADAKPAAAAG